MNKNMKIMIAYDGLSHSEMAIDDLQFAGLPRQGEALIVSVQDSLVPPALSDVGLIEKSLSSARILQTSKLLQEESAANFAKLQKTASESIENVRLYLPEWKIESKTLEGNPSESLWFEAEFWKPDLVVVGSHKRTSFGRFFFGSVSTELAGELDCNVRIVHHPATENFINHPRLITVIEDSAGTETVIRHIGNRVWNNKTCIRLVLIDDKSPAENFPEILTKKQLMLEWAIEQLQAIGLNVSVEFIRTDSANALLEAAEKWQANSIFVAAEKAANGNAQRLNEMAKNLVTEATCTIEIVR